MCDMQIAPRELLTARGGLTKTTERLLTSPPVPLQLSTVQPGSEYPDPADIAAMQDKKVCAFGLSTSQDGLSVPQVSLVTPLEPSLDGCGIDTRCHTAVPCWCGTIPGS